MYYGELGFNKKLHFLSFTIDIQLQKKPDCVHLMKTSYYMRVMQNRDLFLYSACWMVFVENFEMINTYLYLILSYRSSVLMLTFGNASILAKITELEMQIKVMFVQN